MAKESPLLFALGVGEDFARGLAAALGVALAPLQTRDFEDGEHKLRPETSVREQDCYVLCSLHGDREHTANDKLCRLLFLAATLHDHGAARVTLVCPYLAYARKDRRTKRHDPVTTRYVAQLIEAMGVDRVAVLEPHNPSAFDNSFRIPAEYLHARTLLADALLAHVGAQPLAVVSPDTGGAKRAEAMREVLTARTGEVPATAFLDKHRSEGVVSGDTVAGDVDGRVAVIVDDLVAGGTTLGRAARACRDRGAVAVHGVVTHAMFTEGAASLLQDPVLDRLIVTDSVAPRMQPYWGSRVQRVSVQTLLAEAIHALHTGGSLSEVLAP